MMPVDKGKDRVRIAAEDRRGADAALLRCHHGRLAGGAVCIAGVDQRNPELMLAPFQVALSDDQRRRDHFVAGEHGGGGRRLVGHCAGEVRLTGPRNLLSFYACATWMWRAAKRWCCTMGEAGDCRGRTHRHPGSKWLRKVDPDQGHMTCECYPIVRAGMEMKVYGRDRWEVQELREHLGVVATELPGERTAVTRGLDAVVSGFFSSSTLWPNLVVTESMRSSALEALGMLGAEYLRDRWVGEMSAGEKRRVMIARALVHRPEMLLLDEPSNALDLAAQRELREILRAVAVGSGERRGTGLVMVTHHLADILPEIDRVVMMGSGRIVADGPKRELLQASRLRELFGVDLELTERNGYWHSW